MMERGNSLQPGLESAPMGSSPAMTRPAGLSCRLGLVPDSTIDRKRVKSLHFFISEFPYPC